MRKTLLISISAVLLVAATVWIIVGPWWLIRYPTNLDQTLHYSGTVATPVTPGASSEVRQPLAVTRHLRVVRSTFDTVWLRETVTTKIGSDVRVQQNGYVLDRRTMKPVTDAGNFAYTSSNQVDRSGAYTQIQFPMHVAASGGYKVWSDDTGSTLNALSSGTAEKSGHLHLHMLTAHAAPHAISDAYAKFLALPQTTTLTDLAAIAHVDLTSVTSALATVVPPAGMTQVGAVLSTPIPLKYQLESTGTVGVEPLTGGIVKTRDIGNRLTVAPDLSVLHLRTALAAYALDPTVRTVLSKFDELATRPPVAAMSLSYSITPASERAAAHAAADLRNKSRLVSIWLPGWASAIALVMIAGAAVPPRRREVEPVEVHPATRHWWHRAA